MPHSTHLLNQVTIILWSTSFTPPSSSRKKSEKMKSRKILSITHWAHAYRCYYYLIIIASLAPRSSREQSCSLKDRFPAEAFLSSNFLWTMLPEDGSCTHRQTDTQTLLHVHVFAHVHPSTLCLVRPDYLSAHPPFYVLGWGRSTVCDRPVKGGLVFIHQTVVG